MSEWTAIIDHEVMPGHAGETLRPGTRLRVTYRLEGQGYDRVFVGTYLGRSYSVGYLDFDLRPDAGTSSLPISALTRLEVVGSETPHHQPRRA